MVIASGSTVAFINGAQPCNVFWQVTSSASLGTTTNFVGTIMAQTSITMDNGVTLNGRALAQNGDVTLINDTIIRSSCSAVSTTPTPTFGPTPGPATPAPTAAATVAPSAAPSTGATATPIGRTAAPAAPSIRLLPSTTTNEDHTSVILTLVAIGFASLYMVARARRRSRHLVL
jgi:type VI secretion system secreted protein VgrG